LGIERSVYLIRQPLRRAIPQSSHRRLVHLVQSDSSVLGWAVSEVPSDRMLPTPIYISACPFPTQGSQLTFVNSSAHLEVYEHQFLQVVYIRPPQPAPQSAYRSRTEDVSKVPVRPKRQNTAQAVLDLLISFGVH